jgi:hypothetical protein
MNYTLFGLSTWIGAAAYMSLYVETQGKAMALFRVEGLKGQGWIL